MISYKTQDEIDKMRRACRIVADCLHLVRQAVRPGVSTLELDDIIRDFVKQKGGQPLFYKYRGFPANSCISINDEVVHGIPRRRRKLREGDIVSVDVGVKIRGYCGDSAWTFPVGDVSDDVNELLGVGREALYRGVAACQPGNRVSDIGRAIQTFVEGQSFFVVKKFVGHGIGTQLHEDPQVPNYVDKGTRGGAVLREGLVLAIEPMVNVGTEDVEVLDDRWTVVTRDRGLSAHFEHTVVVTVSGPDILTLRDSGEEV